MSLPSTSTLPLSSQTKSKGLLLPEKLCAISTFQIANDVPCQEDIDVEELPQPRYTPDDIQRVQTILRRFVPLELADAILDMAEFWPWVSVSRNSFMSASSALEAPDGNAQWCYLVSPAIPAIQKNGATLPTVVKKVDFSIKTYESSFGKTERDDKSSSQGYKTWFESSILKSGAPGITSYDNSSTPNDWYMGTAGPHPKLLNDFGDTVHQGEPASSPLDLLQRWHIRNNPHSNSDKEWQRVSWRQGGLKQDAVVDTLTGEGSGSGFVDSLEVNDRILLMARAMSPGWIDRVFNVKVDIYYAFASSYL